MACCCERDDEKSGEFPVSQLSNTVCHVELGGDLVPKM